MLGQHPLPSLCLAATLLELEKTFSPSVSCLAGQSCDFWSVEWLFHGHFLVGSANGGRETGRVEEPLAIYQVLGSSSLKEACSADT